MGNMETSTTALTTAAGVARETFKTRSGSPAPSTPGSNKRDALKRRLLTEESIGRDVSPPKARVGVHSGDGKRHKQSREEEAKCVQRELLPSWPQWPQWQYLDAVDA